MRAVKIFLICLPGVLFIDSAIAGNVLIVDAGNDQAPPEIVQFGQFEGSWSCKGFNPQEDGSWQANPWVSKWVWYYVLDGYAVQDVWIPGAGAPPGAAMGTNLRIYNPEQNQWHMVWTTHGQNEFDYFSAEFVDGAIVMHGEMPQRGQRNPHLAQITFYNIGEEHFDWKYDFSPLADGQNWTEAARLACERS